MSVFKLIPELQSYYEHNSDRLPLSLARALRNLGEEDVPFAGDELAALAEELIRTLCGLVIAAYLQGDTEDDELNMQIIALFMGNRKFSPGATLGLTRRLGKNLAVQKAHAHILHFASIINDDRVGDEKGILSQGLNFRNSLMHGTFLAPAGKLREVTVSLLEVLGMLTLSGSPEFTVLEGVPFAGSVKLYPLFIVEDGIIDLAASWNLSALPGDNEINDIIHSLEATWARFADLFFEYLDETSGVFLEKEKNEALAIAGELPLNVRNKLDSGTSSLRLVTWWNTDHEALWGAVTKYLLEKKDTIVLSWRMHKGIIRYYREVMLGALEKVLLVNGYKKSKNESTLKFLDKNLGSFTKKQELWVVVDSFHHNMNRDVHLRNTLNILAERGVRFVASGYGYPELARHFTDRIEVFTGTGPVPSIDELVDSWSSFSGIDATAVARIKYAAAKLWETTDNLELLSSPGFKMEQALSLRRLHDSLPALAGCPLRELEYAAEALAPILSLSRQENWLEYNPRGGLEDTPVVFHEDFADMTDYKKFEPEKRLYRMFRHSVYPDRKKTEVDPVYETMGRDDIALEYRPAAVKRIQEGL